MLEFGDITLSFGAKNSQNSQKITLALCDSCSIGGAAVLVFFSWLPRRWRQFGAPACHGRHFDTDGGHTACAYPIAELQFHKNYSETTNFLHKLCTHLSTLRTQYSWNTYLLPRFGWFSRASWISSASKGQRSPTCTRLEKLENENVWFFIDKLSCGYFSNDSFFLQFKENGDFHPYCTMVIENRRMVFKCVHRTDLGVSFCASPESLQWEEGRESGEVACNKYFVVRERKDCLCWQEGGELFW